MTQENKVAEIPQSGKDKIDAEYPTTYNFGSVLFDDPFFKTKRRCAEFGYSLAQQEIERLKGLIEKAYVAGAACSNNIIHTSIVDYVPNPKGVSLIQFKTENNL